MLMRAVAEGRLTVEEPSLLLHLDRCLGCRACEAVCPAGVAYGDLIDQARAFAAEKGRGVTGVARLLPALFASPFLLGLSARVRFREHYPAWGKGRGTVSLFLGCVGQFADAETLRASIFVLSRLGYAVRVPRGQGCCGAMHQHGGDPARAAELAQRNIAAFGGFSPLAQEAAEWPVLFAASGCGASLVEYGRHGEAGTAFARRALDVVSFLVRAEGWEAIELAPLAETVAVHEPCTARNVLGNAGDVTQLLSRIPGLRLAALPGNDQCCGAAGLYFLRQPEIARRLRAAKMPATLDFPRLVVTTNHGCRLWLQRGLRQAKGRAEVLHPVVLLARQMGFRGKC
jgi:glycolate oxidase iron-sulfur subunit